MSENLRYVIFRTRLVWFGLLAGERGLLRTSLPIVERGKAKRVLLTGIRRATCDARGFVDLQEKIKLYFEGSYVDFADTRVILDGLGEFGAGVLTACRKVEYGQTISYGELARLAGRPGAGRAVGNVLARNPVPLIVPCHRVIRSDGKIGGFSAIGGISLKKKMLELEQRCG